MLVLSQKHSNINGSGFMMEENQEDLIQVIRTLAVENRDLTQSLNGSSLVNLRLCKTRA